MRKISLAVMWFPMLAALGHARSSRPPRKSWSLVAMSAKGVRSILIVLVLAAAATGQVPSISGLSPNSGTAGTSVTISGSGFGADQNTSTVNFFGGRGWGSVSAAVSSWADTSITVTVPSQAVSGNVTVTTSGGTSAGAFFTRIFPPSINNLTPSAGPIGATVTIGGNSLGSSGTVTFNGTPATPSSWNSGGNGQIVTVVPSGATTGNVVVTANSMTSNGMLFTVTDGVTPSLTSITPTSGTVGTAVTITGTGFAAAQGSSTITFNGVGVTASSWSDTSIVAPVPDGALSGNVVVTVGDLSSNGLGFTVVPAVNAVTPAAGPVGTYVTVSGSGFGSTQGSSTLTFNGTAATAASWSSTSIVVQVPSGASSGNLVVTVGGTPSSGVNFPVTTAPVVQSNSGSGTGTILLPFLSPNQAGNLLWVAVGTGGPMTPPNDSQGNSYTLAVSVLGTGAIYYATSAKAGANTVNCNPSGSSNLHCHIAEVTGLLPFSPLDQIGSSPYSSPCSISTAGATGQANEWVAAFFYDNNNHALTPGSGYNTLQGTNDTTGSAALSESQTVTSAGVQTAACGAPSSDTLGQMITAFRIASNGPDISSLSPAAGPVGTTVTISGIDFGSVQGSSTVTFNGTLATPTNWSANSIVVNVPSGASSGNVIVTTGAGASPGVPYTVTVAPSISALSPESGPIGTSVSMMGTNFGATQGSSTVTFNGTPGTPSTWFDTGIVVPVPSGATTGNVVVTVNGLASNGFLYMVEGAPPNITSLSPSTGIVGTAVTITGANFGSIQGYSYVTFNGETTPRQIAPPSSWSDTQIVVPVPFTATSGNVMVVFGGHLTSNSVAFTVPPHISSLSPATGVVDSSITINGTGFDGSQGSSTVTLNGTPLTPTGWSYTQIRFTVPSGVSSGNVVVTVKGVASNGVPFGLTPNITGVLPISGPVGSPVTITGANFGSSQGSSTITFNGTAATATAWSASSITATVPPGATTGNVVVTVAGVPSNGVPFTVTPGITSLSPTSGPVGTAVTITGTTFGATQGSSTVTFNGTTATPTSWTDTQIMVPVPSAATSGNVVVTVGGKATSGLPFTVTPAITSLSPTSGPVGTTVTITGTTFGASQGTSTVTFNGAAATPTSWSDTQIVVPVPSAATTGNVVVTVAGNASNGVPFTVIPTITSLSPNSGTVGTSVTITGTGFEPTQGTSTVTFNGTAATPTSWSNTQIVVPVPPAATSGNVVVTVAGNPSNGVPFTLIPVITSLTPASGAVNSTIVIAGSGFGPNPGTVSFAGTTAPIILWSVSSITAVVPASAASGNLVVTTSAGTASTGVPYTVVPPPSISSLSINSGAVGASVTITGANFGSPQGNGAVTFNGTPATTISNWSSSSITTVVPIGATTGFLVVVAPGGVVSVGVDFTILDPTKPPEITSLNLAPPPGSKPGTLGLVVDTGPPGMGFFINGSHFGQQQQDSSVTIGGVVIPQANIVSWSDTQIEVQVPAKAKSGPVVVTVGSNPGASTTQNPNFNVSSLGCN